LKNHFSVYFLKYDLQNVIKTYEKILQKQIFRISR
jgi:hypothetical protein